MPAYFWRYGDYRLKFEIKYIFVYYYLFFYREYLFTVVKWVVIFIISNNLIHKYSIWCILYGYGVQNKVKEE